MQKIIKDKKELKDFVMTHDYKKHYNGGSIESYIEERQRERLKASEETKKFENVAKALEQYNVSYDKEAYDAVLNKLRANEDELNDNLKLTHQFLKDKSETCEHNFIYIGHDSHYDYEMCSICGKEVKC